MGLRTGVVGGGLVAAMVLGACSVSGDAGGPASPSESGAAGSGTTYDYGDIVEVTPDVRLVVGREIDVDAQQVDIANVVLYRTGSTLVVIDSGGTTEFLTFLDEAAAQLEPYDDVVLVNSHGHSDHVGNNAWIDTLDADSVEQYISASALGAMRDPVAYFAAGFTQVDPFLPNAPPGSVFAEQIVGLFGGLNTETSNLIVLESLPLAAFNIDAVTWSGWSLVDDTVQVFRTGGHSGGHVVVYLPDVKLLHMSDETTGFYQVFPDADPVANLATLQRGQAMLEVGAVTYLTDGHSFSVHTGDEAIAYIESFIDGALAYDAAVTRIFAENPDGLTLPQLVEQVSNAPELANAPGGANPIPTFAFMQALNKLRELGIQPPTDAGTTVSVPG